MTNEFFKCNIRVISTNPIPHMFKGSKTVEDIADHIKGHHKFGQNNPPSILIFFHRVSLEGNELS